MLQAGAYDVVCRLGVIRCADYAMAARVRAAVGQGYIRRAVYVVAGGAK